MKKLIALLLALVLALGLAACGSTATTTTPPEVLGSDTADSPSDAYREIHTREPSPSGM